MKPKPAPATPAATPMAALRAGLIELCDEWESEKEIQEPTERSEWYEMALKRCARSVKMLLGLWPPKSGQPAAQPQRESERREVLEPIIRGWMRVAKNNPEIFLSWMENGGMLHELLGVAALSPQTDSLSTQQGGPQHG